MASQLCRIAFLLLLIIGQVQATTRYTVRNADDYSGAGFFGMWNFFDGNDPTGGFVDYQSRDNAQRRSLISYNPNTSQNFMRVDSTATYPTFQTPSNRGRSSVRIESKKSYTHGLFIADIAHMPASVCGTWPAFWTMSHINYPAQGEIDILENIHEESHTLETLHTTPGCTVAGNQGATRQTGSQTSYNCDDSAATGPFGTSQSPSQGCAAVNDDPSSYGTPFNAQGGGVFAVEWTSDHIKIWNWARSSIPQDIALGQPNPESWKLPVFTTVGGTCDIDRHFKDHRIIFDTTFCGYWAGQSYFWQKTSCYKNDPTRFPTCVDYVASNPSVFSDAYWAINSVRVYQ